MSSFYIKLKLVFLRFFAVSLLFIIAYSLFNFLIIIKMGLPLDEELISFWLPICLSFISVFIWIRPRIKLLTLKDKKGNLPFLYQFAAAAAIVAPTIFSQLYLNTAAGKLTILQNVNSIQRQPITQYYKLKHHFIDKAHIVYANRSETSGRNNEYLDFYIDIVCPILVDSLNVEGQQILNKGNKTPLFIINGKLEDSLTVGNIDKANISSVTVLKGQSAIDLYGEKGKNGIILIKTKGDVFVDQLHLKAHLPVAWMGVEFKKGVDNRLSFDEKKSAYKDFATSTQDEFNVKSLDQFTYLRMVGTNAKHKGFLKALKNVGIDKKFYPIILEGVAEPFEARNGDNLTWIFYSFGIGAVIFFIMIVIPKIDNAKLKEFQNPATAESDWNKFLKNIKPFVIGGNMPVTAVIIAINILMFIIMVFAGLGVVSFSSNDLLSWGADHGPEVMNGQWWRLLTSTFLHGGLMHLLMNMYGLFFAAIFLEPLLGKAKYALAYLFCGLVASAVSLWWHPNVISIGASGAIFGLYGVLVALLATNKFDPAGKKILLLNCAIFIAINLVIGLTGGIDNAALIGGLLAGIAMGYIFYFFIDKPRPLRKPTRKKVTELQNPDSLTF